MATLLRFKIDPGQLQNAIQVKHDQAEASRRLHFIAARKIQAWFRGIVTRAHLRRLHEHATTLQRHWRGYRTRILFRRYLIEYVHQMWQDYYNSMATMIQAVWRGYWTRKTRINFVQLRRWLQAVYTKNNEVLENMKKYRQAELEHMESTIEQESLLRILFILFKVKNDNVNFKAPGVFEFAKFNVSLTDMLSQLHHMLRTESRPGVITRIDKTHFTYIEEMLKCLQYERCIPRARFFSRDREIDHGPLSISRDSSCVKRNTRKIREFERSLRNGNVPVFKSASDHLFKGDNRIIAKNKCSSDGRSNKYSCGYLHRNFTTVELYETIHKMDCPLDRLFLKCPIHSCFL